MKFERDKNATVKFQFYINESKNLQNLMRADEITI
jgi:hypothetical protein